MTKATRSLRLPSKAPPCWDSQREWNLYREGAEYSANDGFTYCTDCTPERKARMIAASRCRYPKTVFIMNTGRLIGRRRK